MKFVFPSWHSPAVGCALLGCLVLGCGSDEFKEPPKVPVSGKVLVNGEPLADGAITFEEGAKGLFDQAPIQGGEFNAQVSPGEKRVLISAMKDGPPNEMYPDTPTKVNIIPEKYNSKTELKETIPAEGKSGLEYKLETK